VNALLALVLFSATFASGATVPQAMIALPCGGSNLSPQLRWSGVPSGTRSLALVLHDPDAPHPGGFYHWVVYDLPPRSGELAAAAPIPASRSGRNDSGSIGYFGPCPPPGKLHHYHLTLYALDVAVRSMQPLDAEELQQRMRGHILAQTELVAVLQRTRRD